MYINTIIHNTTKMKIFFVHVCSQVIHLNPFSSRYQISQNSIFKTKSQSFVVISPIIRQVKNVPLTEPLYQGPLPQVL